MARDAFTFSTDQETANASGAHLSDGDLLLAGELGHATVKALIVANHFLETDLDKLQAAVSMGCARGKLFEQAKTLPRDRKDWYD